MSFMEKMMARKEQLLSNSKGYEKVNWFRPQDGEQKIRILPHIKNLDFKNDIEPFHEIAVHYVQTSSGKGYNVRCERDRENGGDCPFCKKYEELLAAGDKDGAANFRARRVVIVNILNYKDKCVQPYMMSLSLFRKVIGYVGDYGNPFSLTEGRDWKLIRGRNPAKTGKLAIEYSIMPLASESAVPAKAMPMIEEMDPIEKYFNESGVADMKKALYGSKVIDDEEQWAEQERSRSSRAKTKSEEEVSSAKLKAESARLLSSKKQSSKEDYDDDFDDLEKEFEDIESDLDL